VANQYPKVSNENRQRARLIGEKTYISGTPCKKCGSFEKYVSSMGCVPCNIERNRPKLLVLIETRKIKTYNPEKRHRNKLRYGYKLSVLQYNLMLAEQNGRCAICGTVKCDTGRRFAVDHDHETGTIRGLLCRACNQGLGQFKDNPELLSKAFEYLKRRRP